MIRSALGALCVLTVSAGACSNPVEPAIHDLATVEIRLAELAREYRIPALSAGIVDQDGIPWTRGFGSIRSDGVEPPDGSTVFHLASLTKTFASAVVLRLAEEGRLGLDDPVSGFGVQLPGDVRVRHLLTHTSEGVPGVVFRYNGDRFAELDKVVRTASGTTFAQLATEWIIDPLGLSCTGPSSVDALRRRLVPGFDAEGRAVPYPNAFSTAAGMLSCVDDMLAYASSWDSDRVIGEASRNAAFTAARSAGGGEALPYGLGWFVTEMDGQKVVWHYGLWTGISALIVKLPESRRTFVLLANNEELSRTFQLGAGELLSSPFARVFLAWALGRDVRP